MRGRWKRGAFAATLIAASAAAVGCAQDVGDIDRTQPNRVKKSDLTEGTWFMNQKVTHVPGNASFFAGFEGEMMETDKVRFVAEENYLIAYRSYPFLAGSDGDTTIPAQNYDEVYNQDYKGAIMAMFPIESHFDVQREYDSSTGEQSNVISENTHDRPWYEREFIRVSWDSDPLVNFLWRELAGTKYELGYQETNDTEDPQKAPYFEYDKNGRLVYFDAPTNYVVQSTRLDLWYNWYADWAGSAEIRVVTSFVRDLGYEDSLNNYEPATYPNQDMNRFGFFRTERNTYDPHTGLTLNSGRINHAYRHNIWEKSYDIDDNGVKTVIPIEERKVRTIPYYIHGGAADPVLAAMSRQVIDEWNVAFKRAVYLMQHPTSTFVRGVSVVTEDGAKNFDQVNLLTTIDYPILKAALKDQQEIFVPCEIPVASTDDPACGPAGFVPRDGDFRNNYLWLITQRQDVGLLGYCPTAFDPLTGRSISAQAHVYTAPMNQIANNIVDHLRFYKGEFTAEGIRKNDAAVASAKAARDSFIEISQIPDKLRNGGLTSPLARENSRDRKLQREEKRHSLQRFNYERADKILKKAIDTGLLSTEVDDELLKRALQLQGVKTESELDDNLREAASLFGNLSLKKRKEMRSLKNYLSSKGYCFDEGREAGDTYGRILEKYKNRSDYENIYKEIRADVFRATALHEMGHGFGLRHNHSGSYDSMNYFDKFWELRPDSNFMQPTIGTAGDMYAMYAYNHDQVAGGMLDQMYSSIMDYASGYLTDNMGLGRYDHAAILYGYSAGTFRDTGVVNQTTCDEIGGTYVEGSCSVNTTVLSADAACAAVSGSMQTQCFDKNNSVITLTDGASCTALGGHYDRLCVAGTMGIPFASICVNNIQGAYKPSYCAHYGKGLVEVFTTETPSPNAADASLADYVTYMTASGARNRLGDLAGTLLVHKDTTDTSTMDDLTTIGQPYLEIAHYHDIFQPMLSKGYDFLKNRALIRMDEYLDKKTLDAKGNSAGSSYVRVPYLFCTDDDRGLLRSCYVFDHGADYMEQVIDHMASYNDEYWFTNFARDRYAWSPWRVAMRHESLFFDLSDYFQNWWIGDFSMLDDVRNTLGVKSSIFNLVDNVASAASSATFNFLANVVATPEYGQFCRRQDNGQLYPLTSEYEAREETSTYIRNAYCGLTPEYFYVRQGEGRRRYNRYDPNVGFDYSWYPLEAGHYMTSLSAILALFDNEAEVIADSGDINTYTFGLYDMFTDELIQLFNHVYAEEYGYHSPRLITKGGTETINIQGYQTVTGSLVYPSISPAYFDMQNGDSQSYDPITAQPVGAFNYLSSTTPLYGICTASTDCVASTNITQGAGFMYCGTLYENQTDKRCFAIYYTDYEKEAKADVPDDSSVEKLNADMLVLVPKGSVDINKYKPTACSQTNHFGSCADGAHCVDGLCSPLEPLVESNSNWSQKVYGLFYGTIFTGYFGSDSKFYEQFAIYRVGSGETMTPPPYYKVVTFEDPFTGEIFAANKLDCSAIPEDDRLPVCDDEGVGGGAMLIERAQRELEVYKKTYDDMYAIYYDDDMDIDNENSEDYKIWMEARYKYSSAKNNLDSTIMYINMVRSIYSAWGTLW